jgi:hypothetical protein
VTDEQQAQLYALNGCTFGVGSFDKRFVRDLAAAPKDTELTERQDWYLRRTYYRYRKQIGHKAPRPADYDAPPEKHSTIEELEREDLDSMADYLKPTQLEKRQARERMKLEAWNGGKAK